MVAFLVLVITVGCGGPAPTASSLAVCVPTQPTGGTPPGENPSSLVYTNGRLYTILWPNGEILATPDVVEPDGTIDMKFPWWRAPGVGAAGDLQITGHEINTGATISASIPGGYGQRFQATGILFPTEGCYEITAKSGDALLTFVTKVTKVAAASPSAQSNSAAISSHVQT
jgi:hypothetical protein